MCEIQIKVLNWSLFYSNECVMGGTTGVLIDHEIVEPHYIPMESEFLGGSRAKKSKLLPCSLGDSYDITFENSTFFCLVQTQFVCETYSAAMQRWL